MRFAVWQFDANVFCGSGGYSFVDSIIFFFGKCEVTEYVILYICF